MAPVHCVPLATAGAGPGAGTGPSSVTLFFGNTVLCFVTKRAPQVPMTPIARRFQIMLHFQNLVPGPTRSHDAVGQVPRDLVRGSQIGPGALGYARGTPATACRPAKKNEIFFLRKLEKPRTDSKSAVDRRDVKNNRGGCTDPAR